MTDNTIPKSKLDEIEFFIIIPGMFVPNVPLETFAPGTFPWSMSSRLPLATNHLPLCLSPLALSSR
jgi:hypothetical protein